VVSNASESTPEGPPTHAEHQVPNEHRAPNGHRAPSEHRAPNEHRAPDEHRTHDQHQTPNEHQNLNEHPPPDEHRTHAEHRVPDTRPGSTPGGRPVIGITTYRERARFGLWDTDSAVLPGEYADTVARAGGIPVLLPPVAAGAAELVARLDGLVLAGGADVDPARYRQQAHPETTGLRPDRDDFEFALLAEALTVGLPVLAVCRGMQVLNCALGGSLVQHLPDHVGHEGHRPSLGVFGDSTVNLSPDSRAAGILGTEAKVRCHHHQAVAEVGAGLSVVGVADDGTVEAVELPGDGFVLGVQWHPEQDSGDDRLVAAMLLAARERTNR
jgi:putative glutamine amidotransferase